MNARCREKQRGNKSPWHQYHDTRRPVNEWEAKDYLPILNVAKISDDGWWMVQMTVMPLFDKCWRDLTTRRAVAKSSPEVGSSQNSNFGSVINSCARLNRLRSPPDKVFFTPKIDFTVEILSFHLWAINNEVLITRVKAESYVLMFMAFG